MAKKKSKIEQEVYQLSKLIGHLQQQSRRLSAIDSETLGQFNDLKLKLASQLGRKAQHLKIQGELAFLKLKRKRLEKKIKQRHSLHNKNSTHSSNDG